MTRIATTAAAFLLSFAATGSAYGDLLVNPDGGRVGIRTRDVLAAEGVTDLAKYAMVPDARLIPDFFI